MHREIPDDEDLRRQWNALAMAAEQPQVFYTFEWALAVYRAYHATLQPLLFLAYGADDVLCGVAALATDPLVQRASFLCGTTGDYCDFLSPPEQRKEFVVSVLAQLKEQNIDQIAFANLPADSATGTVIGETAASCGYRTFARTGYICAQVALSALERHGDAKPVLPRRKMLRRFLNAMGREGPVRLDHARSCDALEAVLPEFIRAHVGRFLVTGRVSNAARLERQRFLSELAKLLSHSGWMVLTRLMSGNQAFAWNYGFRFQGTWFWYQPTFLSDLEKYSPGFCLLAKIIEEAADDPALTTVDLGLGAEEYKDRFANHSRETLYITLNTSAVRHRVESLRYRIAEEVRASPRVEAAARKVLQGWRRLWQRVSTDGMGATLFWAARRLRELVWLECEVLFYEGCGPTLPSSSGLTLRSLDLNALASATSQYIDDQATLGYLLRAAPRVQEGNTEGFGLVNEKGKFLHFAWVTAFDGFFLSELQAKVQPPSSGSMMLFDCWTPPGEQGHGYYGQTVELIAERVRSTGKRPWIFSAAGNLSSVRGLEKTSFQRRYSLVRRRLLGWERLKGDTPKAEAAAREEVAAGAGDSAA